MLGDAGGREHERERMSAGDPVQARRLGPVHPAPLEHELRVRLFERAQRQVAEVLERQPARERPLPPGEHERDLGGQRRHEHLPKPRVHEPEQLVVVQRENDRRRERREMLDELAEIVEMAGGVKEAALGRLDDAAVQFDDAGPGCSPPGRGRC